MSKFSPTAHNRHSGPATGRNTKGTNDYPAASKGNGPGAYDRSGSAVPVARGKPVDKAGYGKPTDFDYARATGVKSKRGK